MYIYQVSAPWNNSLLLSFNELTRSTMLPKLTRICCFAVMALFFLIPENIFAQYTPITVTGFNHDVVAESGTSSLTTTTIQADGGSSNKVMYTVGFRTTNSFGGGGIPDNGVITNGINNFQMAPYTGNNALLLQRTQTGTLTFTTPAQYSSLRILALSTEGVGRVNATVNFSDGTNFAGLANVALNDWFNATTNLVLQGIGRCTRATPASGADGFPTNPRMYYLEIPIACANRSKNIQSIAFTNVTTGGTNAPFPNTIFFAVSGISATQTETVNITNATCTSTGSATVNVTGNTGPYTITWNTTPVQTGATATNLAPGNYTATITNAGSCVSTVPVTITATNNLTLTTNANTSICTGGSVTGNTTSNASTFSWSPTTGVSNPAIASPVFTPTTTTTYTLTASTGTCNIVRSFTITVNPQPALTQRADTSICVGASFSPNLSSDGTSFSWSPTTGVSNATALNPVLSPTTTTTYTVTATNAAGCTRARTFIVTVVPGAAINAGPDQIIIEGQSVAQLSASGSPGTYTWTPATGLSATNILNPVANPTTSTTYTLSVLTANGCIASDDITITVIPYCIKPMEAFTPNGDGINELWLVTNGNCNKNIKVGVYNRYGNTVYESNDYKNDWNGTYKGKPIPDGTYYFVITYTLLNNKRVDVRGNVTVLR
jgi:gliding motility-associated-like protein